MANDVHQVPIAKLHEIFGADAALYMTIEEYGTSYVVLSSETIVRVSATLVDLRSGTVLWQDNATASSAETRGNSGGGIIGMLVEAAMHQILETLLILERLQGLVVMIQIIVVCLWPVVMVDHIRIK